VPISLFCLHQNTLSDFELPRESSILEQKNLQSGISLPQLLAKDVYQQHRGVDGHNQDRKNDEHCYHTVQFEPWHHRKANRKRNEILEAVESLGTVRER
jgi:hypothetical protein